MKGTKTILYNVLLSNGVNRNVKKKNSGRQE